MVVLSSSRRLLKLSITVCFGISCIILTFVVKWMRILANLYSVTNTKIKVSQVYTEEVRVSKGVLQWDSISPYSSPFSLTILITSCSLTMVDGVVLLSNSPVEIMNKQAHWRSARVKTFELVVGDHSFGPTIVVLIKFWFDAETCECKIWETLVVSKL